MMSCHPGIAAEEAAVGRGVGDEDHQPPVAAVAYTLEAEAEHACTVGLEAVQRAPPAGVATRMAFAELDGDIAAAVEDGPLAREAFMHGRPPSCNCGR